MRLLILIALLFATADVEGFQYCSSIDQLYTLWPDWDDYTKFIQCISINLYKRLECPSPLLFGFQQQVLFAKF